MKRALHLFLSVLLLIGIAASCAIDLTPEVKWTEQELALGLDEPEIPVCIGYDLPCEDIVDPATKASVVGGEEDPAEYVKTLYMVCFTKEGIYLGHRQATLVGTEATLAHQGSTLECQGREFFEGTVPARTARIHFVANVPETSIPANDQVGNNENMVVKSARMSVKDTVSRICYWGFHGESSSEAMKSWLALKEEDSEGNITYKKKDGSNVHLVRDRARLSFGEMNDLYNSSTNQITYKILSIDWILSNGLDRGYIAPYNERNSTDHFTGYFDVNATPMLDSLRLTPYDQSNAARYTAQEYINGVDQMVRIYDETNGAVKGSLFLFEDQNSVDNPPKIILRVKYQKHRNSTDVSDQVTKYHTLMLLNQDNAPCKILRNHDYILDILGLPWEGLGYMSFEDAVNSTTYANNMTVTINDKVPEVNNGRFKMSIVGDTYIIYQDPSLVGTEQTVTFRYEAVGSGETTTGIDASNFTAEWEGEIYDTFASPTVTVEDVSTGSSAYTGRVKFTLGTQINTALQEGRIVLRDKKTGMTRFINVYTISAFNFLPDPVNNTPLSLVSTGNSRNVGGINCPEYKMEIRIPGDYPIGLYPIKIRMASTTLNPYKVTMGGVDDTDIAVTSEGTENGTVLDDESLLGMDFTTTAGKWNSRPDVSKPWNYWYIYTIINKPMKEVDGATVEDTDDKVYTVYFDDVRALRASDNRADGVGLFVKIKYFGNAVSVTP